MGRQTTQALDLHLCKHMPRSDVTAQTSLTLLLLSVVHLGGGSSGSSSSRRPLIRLHISGLLLF
jgi:hypothetical protein